MRKTHQMKDPVGETPCGSTHRVGEVFFSSVIETDIMSSIFQYLHWANKYQIFHIFGQENDVQM